MTTLLSCFTIEGWPSMGSDAEEDVGGREDEEDDGDEVRICSRGVVSKFT